MAKKKNISFAEKGKQILQKYKVRLGNDFNELDKPAREALEREMSILNTKQEAAKASIVSKQSNKYAEGGTFKNLPYVNNPIAAAKYLNKVSKSPGVSLSDPIPVENGLYSDLPYPVSHYVNVTGEAENNFSTLPVVSNETIQNFMIQNNKPKQFGKGTDSFSQDTGGYNSVDTGEALKYDSNRGLIPANPVDNTFSGFRTSPLPLIASTIGGIASLREANKSLPDTNYNPNLVTPETIDLSSQREQISRNRNQSRGTVQRIARDIGSSQRSQALQIAGISNVDSVSNQAIGESFLNEQTTNAQILNNAEAQNNSAINRSKELYALTKLDNARAKQEMKLKAISQFISGFTQFGADYQNTQNLNASLPFLSENYQLTDNPDNPNLFTQIGRSLTGSPKYPVGKKVINSPTL